MQKIGDTAELKKMLRETRRMSKSEYEEMKKDHVPHRPDCLICRDLGAIDCKQPREEYGTLAWMNAGVKPDDIIWCDCEAGEKARTLYAQEYSQRSAEIAKRRLDRQFELAGAPPLFESMIVPRPGQWKLELMAQKHRAYAACRMMMDEGHVVPSRLGVYDPRAKLRPTEKVVRPDWKYKSLTLMGPKGVGKTAALSTVFRHFLESGVAGLWIEWYNVIGEIQQGYDPNNDIDPEEKIRAIQQAPLVMIDDLGDVERTTRETDDRRRILWRILDFRHNRDMQTLVSSNLQEPRLRAQFDDRAIDRLAEMSFMVPMGGANLRTVEV